MSMDLISYVKPGGMFLTTNGEIVTADEKGVYMAPYDNVYMVNDEYEHEYTEEDIDEVFMDGLYTAEQVYDKVQTDYRYDDNSLCPAYFDFQVHNIPKIDLLRVYIELQSDINADYLILVEEIDQKKAREVVDLCHVSDFTNLYLNNIEGSFTGNMRDFLTQLEYDNPNLCRFSFYEVDENNVILSAESTGFFARDFFYENFDYKDKEGECDYES